MAHASRNYSTAFILFIALLFSPGSLAAQAVGDTIPQEGSAPASRREILEKWRAAKLDSLRPPPQNSVEKAFVYIEENRIMDRLRYGYHHFFPAVGGLTTGSGMALGVRYANPDLPSGSEVHLSAIWSFLGYEQYSGAVSTTPWRSLPLVLGATARYRDFPQEDFYGLGTDSRLSDETNYRLEDFRGGGEVKLMIVPGLSVAGELAYQKSRTGAGTSDESPTVGEIFESVDATGYSESIEHRIVGTRLALDLRDVANNPRSGIGVFIDHTLFDDSDSDRFSYQSTSTEFQGYLPFLHKHRVIALRVRAATTQGREGGDVPFYHLPYIGGGQSVRGFREYRFRDRRQLLVNLEYRFEAFIGCDVALFADAGQVGDSWDVFTFEDFVTSNGVGLRFNTYQNVFLRLDLAHGKEGTRFLFKFENAF